MTGVVDASAVTAIRTAAVSAVATRALAREGAATLAVLGAGVQAAAHIEAMACVHAARARAHLLAPPRAGAAELAASTAERYGVDASAAASVEEALREADVVVTATTAREPIVERGWLAPGRARQRRRLEHPDHARARRRHGGRARASSSTRASRRVNESGDFLLAVREGARRRRTCRWSSSARC